MFFTTILSKVLATCAIAASTASATSQSWNVTTDIDIDISTHHQGTNRLIFAHFMIGIVGDRTKPSDYDLDMIRAKNLGIDAFALNIGTDWYTDTQLDLAYQSAANNDMKVFLSFDFNWWSTSNAAAVGNQIALYANRTSQLWVDGKAFVSSFGGDGIDVTTLRKNAGCPVFFAPNFHPSYGTNMSSVDGALNWMGWPNNGQNKAPTAGANISVAEGDAEYIAALKGKSYVAPVSPWFSTHYGPEVSYSKNWVFPSDLLWYDRWNEILELGPRFVEIVSWNDYGESHYVGPLKSLHYDDGNSKWVNDMPHNGWLEMAKPFMAAFHDGAKSAKHYVKKDQLVYWYRPNLRALDCDTTDTTALVSADNSSGNYFQGRPNGWESMADSIFVVSLLTKPGIITVMSGNNTQQFLGTTGVNSFQVPMGVGKQQFFLQRGFSVELEAVSLYDVKNVCSCGLYNFNAYVGTVPDGESDQLGTDAINSLTVGLLVTTCENKPTLPVTTIKPTVLPPGAIAPFSWTWPNPLTTIATRTRTSDFSIPTPTGFTSPTLPAYTLSTPTPTPY